MCLKQFRGIKNMDKYINGTFYVIHFGGKHFMANGLA